MSTPGSESDKKAPNPKRSTFLTGREVIERSRGCVESALESLEQAPAEGDERTGLLRESLGSLQRDLSEVLGRFSEGAPQELLDEQTQYTVEVPAELAEDREPPTSFDETLRWALTLTRSLHARFDELASSASAQIAKESYQKLAELVTAYERRIARLAEGKHDL